MNNESGLFTDDFLTRFASKHGIETDAPQVPAKRIAITVEQIEAGVKSGVLEKLGGGFIRSGHRIWSLEKEGDEMFLIRKEDEKI